MRITKFKKAIKIQNLTVGDMQPVFIIAEGGVNHFGSLDKAKSLVDLAVRADADAFKIQVFKTESLICSDSNEWKERLKTKELTFNEIEEIKDYCQFKGIIFLATAHDEESLDFIVSLDIPAFKIGSGELNNNSFIRKVAKQNKPVILSTGMYTLDEIGQTLDTITSEGNKDVVVLHCVTTYPAPPETVNLKAMDTIRKKFNVIVGYSDHTAGHEIPLAAVARGARVIEKHITIDRNIPNAQDWKVSCGPEDFAQFVRSIRNIEAAIGTGIKVPGQLEKESMIWARKSLVAAVKIAEGEVITYNKICIKRPGHGIDPTELDRVVGKKAKEQINKDTLIKWEQLK